MLLLIMSIFLSIAEHITTMTGFFRVEPSLWGVGLG